MGYEARQEAMNDFVAARARELMPNEDEYTMDEDIPERIEDGDFDEEVWQRIKVLFDGWCSDGRHRFYDYLLEEVEK